MTNSQHVALLATGDEIINGDILNTNSQATAERLFSCGILPGIHMTVSDNKDDIKTAIQYLLQTHRAVIITGGLGPTSDDLTRYALADALDKALIFDELTWNNIVERLKNVGYDTPPDSNKQQALFPETSTIIPNANGTAAGCSIQRDEQWVFMLPGPPAECLPMLNEVVIPILMKHGFKNTFYHQKWLLLGVSEGEIAETLDAIAKSYDCKTGYRICYPYIECKIYSQDENDFLALSKKINDAVANYIIDDGKLTASEKLKQLIPTLSHSISIHDRATGGLLESTLLTPQTCTKLLFHTDKKSRDCHVDVKGLDEFWQDQASKTTKIEITIQDKHYIQEIPLRGIRVKGYAVEFICKIILRSCLVKGNV